MSENYQRQTVSVKEFCLVTGLAGSSVRKWLQDGDLKGKKAGKRKWLIPVSELQKLINP